MPPHDVAAEQCVLGGMLLSKDAISDVIEMIRPTDHYRPAHQLIHEAILDLYGRGEPADAITVANELTRRGEIARVGGGPYLHTLIASVPTAANAGYYARIVRERAILRRLVEAGTRIVQFGYAGEADADDLVDRAQAEVYAVTDRRNGEDYHSLSEIMPGALDEIEAIGSRGGGLTGVPTGFADLDSLTNGLHPGQMVVIAARPAIGKALALDTPLPTPAGWTTMGEVQAGDFLLGADGRPTRVVAATEVMTGRPCYEVEFSDGTVIVADANHQWRTTTGSRTEIVTTAGLAAAVPAAADGRRPAVAAPAPAELADGTLPFPPYALGAWLSSGASSAPRITTGDPEIVLGIEAEGLLAMREPGPADRYTICRAGTDGYADQDDAGAMLDRLGVLAAKHIPEPYLRASQGQRRALLAGLLDAGGEVDEDGTIRLAVISDRLGAGVLELIFSLGYRATMTQAVASLPETDGRASATVTFTPGDKVFRLPR